jgi:hypothetical protein
MGFGRLSDKQIADALRGPGPLVKAPDSFWLDAKITFYRGGYYVFRGIDVTAAVGGIPGSFILKVPIGLVYHPVKWVARTAVHGTSRTWTSFKKEFGWVPRLASWALSGSPNNAPTPPPVAPPINVNQGPTPAPAPPPPNAPPTPTPQPQ